MEEFGIFSFSISLGTAVFLLIDSVSFLVQTKAINLFSKINDNNLLFHYINKFKSYNLNLSFFIVFTAIIINPIFFYFFKEYQNSQNIFNLFLLSTLLLSYSNFYQYYLMSKRKFRLIATISIFCLFKLILLSFIIWFLNLSSYYYIIALLFTHMSFSLILTYYTNKILNFNSKLLFLFKSYFFTKHFFVFSLFFITVIIDYNYLVKLFVYLTFLFILRNELKKLYDLFLTNFKEPNTFNV
jgi:O-antigen/teichoic acid export membrane protein